jgi:hypothetical protein
MQTAAPPLCMFCALPTPSSYANIFGQNDLILLLVGMPLVEFAAATKQTPTTIEK